LNFDLEKHTILLSYRGSISHGTFIKDHIDDIDKIGVCVAPLSYYIGLDSFEQVEHKYDDESGILVDEVIYDIRKLFRLLLKCNPNVLSLLWCKPEHYLKVTKWGRMLIDNREIFLSKLAYKTFIGYGLAQIKRMSAFQKYEGYMGEKRKKLVDEFGFDVKNASHAIRILEMGWELITTGVLNVYRESAQHLIDIKLGKWSIEDVTEYSEWLVSGYEVNRDSMVLNDSPDTQKANELLQYIILDFHREDKEVGYALNKGPNSTYP